MPMRVSLRVEQREKWGQLKEGRKSCLYLRDVPQASILPAFLGTYTAYAGARAGRGTLALSPSHFLSLSILGEGLP